MATKVCEKHCLIESSMVSHVIGRCINCGELIDIHGENVVIGDWHPDCAGADYWNGTFECAYGYSVTCTECTHGSANPEIGGE